MKNFVRTSPASFFDYVNEIKKHTGKWFFLHVPKTAGSSLVAEMSKVFPEYENLSFNYKSGADILLQKKTILQDFSANASKIASGHFLYEEIVQSGLLQTNTKLFTFIRNPVSRVISEYNYCCSKMHPPHESFVQKYPTIEHYINDENEQNKMSLYLLGNNAPDDIQATEALLDNRYAFIGIQERYPLSLLLLSNIIWTPSLPREEKQRVLKNEKTVEIQKKYSSLIAKYNALDMKIFSILSKRYDQVSAMAWDNIKIDQSGEK